MDYILLLIYRIFSKIARHFRAIRKRIIPNVRIGKNLYCEKDVDLNTLFGGSISLGDNCYLLQGCKLITYGGNITIGNNTSINPYSILYGQGSITIGSNVRIAAECAIVAFNHIFSSMDIPISHQGIEAKGIIIEDDVWLGNGVKVLDGITLGKGCVVGAGSVVTHSTEPFGIYVGVPAKLIKKRN